MSKAPLLLTLAFALLVTVLFLNQRPLSKSTAASKPEEKYAELDASFNLCTPAIFQLSGVDTTRQIAPLFNNLGNHHLPISQANDEAQVFFDQGLRLNYAFNHAEAHRSFMEAARLAPAAPMPHWGQAYVLGPNINDPVPSPERMQEAYEAVQKAKALAEKGTEKEKGLIAALSKRYSSDPGMELEALNQAYMQAMETLASRYPDDAEVLTLYADAVMNTRPWNYWDKEGNPQPNIPQAKEALEKALTLNPEHPGAHHLYIHMVELPKPQLAVPSAEKLATLMPGAGHLVHMPAHIYIRVGRYADAVETNRAAIAADEDYISQCYSQGMYPLAYYPHNIHFLWSAASLLGDRKTALEAARKTAEKVPPGELESLPFLQDFASTPMLSYVRFGMWNELLTLPPPGENLKHLRMIWHYGRGIAFIRKNNLKEAEEELQALATLAEDPALETLIANYTNPSSAIVRVAHEVLAGEIAAARGDYPKAIAHLQRGVKFEEALAYSEPAAWHVPVRHSLGAVLLKANRPQEAEAVYRKDLSIHPNNGWALKGLHKSLVAQGKSSEAEQAAKQFEQAWHDTDELITASVY